MARQFVRNVRRKRAAIQIQRCFRGWLGRLAFLVSVWAFWGFYIHLINFVRSSYLLYATPSAVGSSETYMGDFIAAARLERVPGT